MFLEERSKRRENEEEETSSYRMSIKKRKRSWEFKEKALDWELWRTRL